MLLEMDHLFLVALSYTLQFKTCLPEIVSPI